MSSICNCRHLHHTSVCVSTILGIQGVESLWLSTNFLIKQTPCFFVQPLHGFAAGAMRGSSGVHKTWFGVRLLCAHDYTSRSSCCCCFAVVVVVVVVVAGGVVVVVGGMKQNL